MNLSTLQSSTATHSTIIVGAHNAQIEAWQSALGANASIEWIVSQAAAEWNSDKAMNTAVIPAELLRQIQAKLLEIGR